MPTIRSNHPFRPTCPHCGKRCRPDATRCPDDGTWLMYDPPARYFADRAPHDPSLAERLKTYDTNIAQLNDEEAA